MLATVPFDALNWLLFACACGLTAAAVGTTVSFASERADKAGRDSARNEIERDAIANGVARYVCDPETGDVEFQWISQPNESEVQR